MTILFIFLIALDLKFFVLVMIPLLLVTLAYFGINKTTDLVSRNYWPGMHKDIKKYVRSCNVCCTSEVSRHNPYGLLKSLPIGNNPWESFSMDFITDLPSSNRMSCILVVVDRFTKMAHFVQFKSVPSTEACAEQYLNSIFKLHGLPKDIVSDRSTQFTSKFWNRLFNLLHVDLCLSFAHHQQTNGQTERVNAILEQYLRCYVNY